MNEKMVEKIAFANSAKLADITNKMTKHLVVCAGDSITQGNSYIHYVDFLSWMLNKPIINKGISGNTTADLLARLDADVVALKPKYCVIMIGTNDIGTGVTLETSSANIRAITTKLVSNSITPIYVSIIPNNDDNATLKQNRINYNRWLDQHCRDNWLLYIDVYSLWLNTDGSYKTAMFADATHPNANGTYPIAQTIASRLNAYIPKGDQSGQWYGETQGCPNPLFVGDTDTNGLANNWTASNVVSTATYALSVHPVKGNWQEITNSGGLDANSYASIYCAVSSTEFEAGKYTDVEFDIKTAADLGTCKVQPVLIAFDNALTTLGKMNLIMPSDAGINNKLTVPITEANGLRIHGSMLMPANTAYLRFYYYVYGAGTTTAYIGNVVIKKRLQAS